MGEVPAHQPLGPLPERQAGRDEAAATGRAARGKPGPARPARPDRPPDARERPAAAPARRRRPTAARRARPPRHRAGPGAVPPAARRSGHARTAQTAVASAASTSRTQAIQAGGPSPAVTATPCSAHCPQPPVASRCDAMLARRQGSRDRHPARSRPAGRAAPGRPRPISSRGQRVGRPAVHGDAIERPIRPALDAQRQPGAREREGQRHPRPCPDRPPRGHAPAGAIARAPDGSRRAGPAAGRPAPRRLRSTRPRPAAGRCRRRRPRSRARDHRRAAAGRTQPRRAAPATAAPCGPPPAPRPA